MSAKSLQRRYTIHEESERRAYARFINKTLINDVDCKKYIQIDPYNPTELYTKVQDGIILCKLLNKTIPDSLDERAINIIDDLSENYAKKMDNLCLVINAARCRGANMGNVDINELYKGDKCTILDTIWQIIRLSLFSRINLYHHPEIVTLKKSHETIDDLKEINPVDIALRFINLHVMNSGLRYFISSFDDDFKDCLVYAHLTYRVAPPNLREKMIDPKTIENEVCVENRIRDVLKNLEILNADCFLTADDFLNGYNRRRSCCKLHCSTVMTLFHYYNGDMPLNKPKHRSKLYGTGGEPLDEFFYRNFLNSFDVYPFINHLIDNLRNGWIFSEFIEILQPGINSGVRMILEFDMSRFYAQRVNNCMKVIKMLKQLDICDEHLNAEKIADSDKSNITFILYHLVFYYFCRDNAVQDDIINWVNCQFKRLNKKITIHAFNDRCIVDQNVLAHLIDSKSPGLIDYSLLGVNKLKNYRYLISIAHKAGIPIYTLAEHFLHGKTEFIGLAFATLMMY